MEMWAIGAQSAVLQMFGSPPIVQSTIKDVDCELYWEIQKNPLESASVEDWRTIENLAICKQLANFPFSYSFATMLVGLCFTLYLMGHVVVITKSKSNSYLSYKKRVDAIRTEMDYHDLPLQLRERVTTYYNYLWLNQKHAGKGRQSCCFYPFILLNFPVVYS